MLFYCSIYFTLLHIKIDHNTSHVCVKFEHLRLFLFYLTERECICVNIFTFVSINTQHLADDLLRL